MQRLLDRLTKGEVLLADGAMGTMLFDRGVKPGDCPERINLKHPGTLEEIAKLYLEAGADIIQTNTFGASPLKLSQYSLDERTEEINVNGVHAVRHVVGDRAYVSASCGPCGKLLKPYGEVSPREVAESFRRQMRALIREGVDMICVETMTDLEEARLAVEAAKSISHSTPVSATMTFDLTPNGFFTIMGVGLEQAAKGLQAAGADIVGSNCGDGIEKMIKIAAEFRKHTLLPLIIQSNAGLPETKEGQISYPETPEFMARRSRELLESGVNIIGGCCGTTPEHIAALRGVVDEFNKRHLGM
jgi:5-methyltetrahydrofolate--homocysteine methyltransferase